jgi:salicylate hydroxylase
VSLTILKNCAQVQRIKVFQRNGRSGQELYKRTKRKQTTLRPPIRTQRTALQSALLAHVKPGTIQLSKKLLNMVDKGDDGVELEFKDGTRVIVDLVVGADGIRSVSARLSHFGNQD